MPLWGALTRRLAVAAGAGTALTALLFDVPVARACLRGGLAWLLLRTIAGAFAWLSEKTSFAEEGDAPAEPLDADDKNDIAAA